MNKREIIETYRDFLPENVSRMESNIERVPEDVETAGVSSILENPVKKWEEKRKSLRTLPAVNVYNEVLDHKLSKSTVSSLACLDAWIGAMDDEIDTKNISKDEKIAHVCNTAFSGSIGLVNLPEEHMEEIKKTLLTYLTELFQIPKVEKEVLITLRDTESLEKELDTAVKFYNYRSMDIDVFAKIPGLIHCLDEEDSEKFEDVVRDLEIFRARELILKDIKDIKRDLKDEDYTAAIILMKKYDSHKKVHERIRKILNAFSYSERSKNSYRQELQDLEINCDLEKEIEKGFKKVKEADINL